jgi:REP element-mobilizing transposase RayT
MCYHIVTATKHRERIITPEVEEILYPLMRTKAKDLGAKILVMGGVEDHVHMAVRIPPKLAVADFVGKVKADSSRVIKKKLRWLDEFKWQKGYGGFTISSFDMQRVLDYVRDQKKHHRDGTLWELMEKIEEDDEDEEMDELGDLKIVG